ncbi:hypothetical protein B0T14DRAFT_561082 [Immersiella caudata]|uniref:Uncharacterized protein n=1 Tax=Immersiella caudata TaxID=314043 RepID=A0AA39XGH0_9PEZI|nr:hypothetical protein B0T14DRAFT_561082 [Immersiella caudata]
MATTTTIFRQGQFPPHTTPAIMAEPSEQEKACYYLGLPSSPRLVARSDFTEVRWALTMEDEHPDLEFITNIGTHDINKKYDASLQQQIILSLSAVDWTSIDVVRIGTNCSTEDPVILWVAVEPGSLSFQQGFKVACQCRAILLQVGLDIHCEIREATVQSAAAGAPDGKQLLSPAASALLPHLYPDGSQRPSSLS